MVLLLRQSLLIVLILFSASLHAQETGVINCAVRSAGEIEAADMLPDCANYNPETSNWRFGLSAGYGRRSNPLINSDDIPVYGMIQLAYTGERFFFDNGDIGYFLSEGKHWELNLIAGVGGERSFFSFLNSSAISFIPESIADSAEPGLGLDSGGPVPSKESGDKDSGLPEPVTIRVKPPERDYTVDGGIEWIVNLDNSDLQMQLLTDISGRHKGQELWLSWSRPLDYGALKLTPSLGFTWKSDRAADYFYGVRDDEAHQQLPAYNVGSAWNPFARLSSSYRLNEQWSVVAVFQYERLDDTIADSPIVEDNHVTTGYLGIYYEF